MDTAHQIASADWTPRKKTADEKEKDAASANLASSYWKQSKPEKVMTSWRIRRHDGELVGWYMTKELAERAIAKSPWLR